MRIDPRRGTITGRSVYEPYATQKQRALARYPRVSVARRVSGSQRADRVVERGCEKARRNGRGDRHVRKSVASSEFKTRIVLTPFSKCPSLTLLNGQYQRVSRDDSASTIRLPFTRHSFLYPRGIHLCIAGEAPCLPGTLYSDIIKRYRLAREAKWGSLFCKP